MASATNLSMLRATAIIIAISLICTFTQVSGQDKTTFAQAQGAYDRGAYGTAIKLLAKPASVEDFILFGKLCAVTKVDGGVAAFADAIEADRGSTRTRSYYALGLIDGHQLDKAMEQVERGLRHDPQSAELMSLKGRCLYKKGEARAGLELMEKAQQRAPRSEIVLYDLARSYTESFDTAAADAAYTRLVKLKPGCVDPLLERAYMYVQAARDAQALGDFAAILKINPCCQLAYWQRAYFYQQRKKYREAIEDCKRCLACPDSIKQIERRVLRLKIDAQERLKLYADAAADSKILTAETPTLVKHWGVRGDMLRQAALQEKLGQYKEALATLDPLYKKAPDRTEVMVLRARILGKAGQYVSSLELCDKLITRDDSIPDWYRMRARALKGLGRGADAERDLRKAAALGDDIPDLPGFFHDK